MQLPAHWQDSVEVKLFCVLSERGWKNQENRSFQGSLTSSSLWLSTTGMKVLASGADKHQLVFSGFLFQVWILQGTSLPGNSGRVLGPHILRTPPLLNLICVLPFLPSALEWEEESSNYFQNWANKVVVFSFTIGSIAERALDWFIQINSG